MDCIFCKIAEGEIPCHKVYEDENFMAFLDINPVNPGHTLIIPKHHYRWVWDIPNKGENFIVVRKVARSLQKAMNTEWVVCDIAGSDVPHAHIHLVPRFEDDGHDQFVNPKLIKKMSNEELEKIAEKIKEAF